MNEFTSILNEKTCLAEIQKHLNSRVSSAGFRCSKIDCRGRLRGPASGHRDSSRAQRGFAARVERTHVRAPWIAASSAKRWLLREAPRSQREALAGCDRVHARSQRADPARSAGGVLAKPTRSPGGASCFALASMSWSDLDLCITGYIMVYQSSLDLLSMMHVG